VPPLAVLGDAGTAVDLALPPQGAVRLFLTVSRIFWSRFGAARVFDVGHRPYVASTSTRISADCVRLFHATGQAAAAGADSVLPGCTEAGMLLTGGDPTLPTFDTTLMRARTLVDLALTAENVGGLPTRTPFTPPRAAG
jgi:aspartate racemase